MQIGTQKPPRINSLKIVTKHLRRNFVLSKFIKRSDFFQRNMLESPYLVRNTLDNNLQNVRCIECYKETRTVDLTHLL